MRNLLEKCNVIKTGHFLLTSGLHSGQYINKDAIYSNPILFSLVVGKIYTSILNNYHHNSYEVVTGPAIAGAVLAAPIALKLNKIFVYPEKYMESSLANDPNNGVIDNPIMKFHRGYDKIITGKRVLIVEDIITTGGSVERTMDAIRKCGGVVAGIIAIWNREGWGRFNESKIISLINENVLSYIPSVCPLCREGKLPLQNPKE